MRSGLDRAQRFNLFEQCGEQAVAVLLLLRDPRRQSLQFGAVRLGGALVGAF